MDLHYRSRAIVLRWSTRIQVPSFIILSHVYMGLYSIKDYNHKFKIRLTIPDLV